MNKNIFVFFNCSTVEFEREILITHNIPKMPNMKRTPPAAQKGKQKLMHSQSKSDPDLSSAMEKVDEQVKVVTSRHKRPRVFESPSDDHDPSKTFLFNFKNALLLMLEDWKMEQKQSLSQLVTDVAQLKVQCSNIQQMNTDIEK